MTVAGLLLAAGEGRRMGTPKALLRDENGVPYIDRAIGALLDGGCGRAVVVLGAAAEEADRILHEHGWTDCEDLDVVVNPAWSGGMASSLEAGLALLAQSADVTAVVVTLVDLPDMSEDLVRRFVALAAPDALARATYDGRPGHPVMLGRDHWAGVRETLAGDTGARAYLDAQSARAVPCEDLASGRDLDVPADLEHRLTR